MDKLDGLQYPNFLSEEIDLLLNQAYERFIKQRYGTTNVKRTSFEETEKRSEDLKEILETAQIQPNTFFGNDIPSKQNLDINTSTFKLTGLNHWFTVWDKAIIHCDSCNTTVYLPQGEYEGVPIITQLNGIEVQIRPVGHMELEKIKKDPFAGPDTEKVLKVMYKDRVELILPEGCRSLYYILRYIKKPTPMSLSGNVTCELSDHTHSEILDMAVDIALEGIEAKRQQTYPKIINTNE